MRSPPTSGSMYAGLLLLCVATAAGFVHRVEQEAATPVTAAGDDAAWRLHMRSVGQFACRRPQKRSIRVADVLAGRIATSETIVPHSTILHRCDAGAGCCQESLRECRVARSEKVEVHFYVVDHILKRKGLRVFVLTNHTLCSCQAVTDDIK